MAEANINDDGHGSTVVAIDHFKEQLLEKYLDLVFVDDVSELSCKRCGRVLIYNYVANCGHLFCSNCKRVLSNGEGWKCPDCKEYVIQFGGQNIEVEERVFGLMVHCLNHKYGCEQTVPLRQITTHLEVCEDTKEANLPIYYTGTNSMEAVMKRMCEMSQELKHLKETMDQSNTLTQDHLKILNEADNQQRTDNGFKWSEFESTIKGLRSDLQVQKTRLQTLIEDNTNINRELEAKRSEMEKTAHHNKHQDEEIVRVREQLLRNKGVIENHIQHQIRDTDRMEALEKKVNGNQHRDTERMEVLEQKVDRLSNLIAELGESQMMKQEQLNQKLQQIVDDKQETTKNDLKKLFHARISKIEVIVKQHMAEIWHLKEQQQSYKQTEIMIKQVECQQQKNAVEMKKTFNRHKKLLTETKSQMLSEEQSKQNMREIEDKTKLLGQQQDEIRELLNKTVDQVEELIMKIQNLTEDSGLNENASQMTVSQLQENAIQGLENLSLDIEMTVEKMKHEEKIQQNTDQNGDLMHFQRQITNEHGEGTSHTTNMDEGNSIRATKSMPVSLNKQPKTKGQTKANQRLIEITECEETNSYAYNECIKRPTKYNVPEYNMLLMAESADEITKFINCFEVLTKYTQQDAALNGYYPLKPLISAPFIINGKDITMAKDEGIAELKNKRCKCYEYLFKGCLVRLIDTAGYGSTIFDDALPVTSSTGLLHNNEQMTERDVKILHYTCNFIEKLQTLHSIVVVMKSTDMELSRSFLNSLKRYLANFNKSRVSNLLFVITDFELALRYKVDKVAQAVENILKYIAPSSGARAAQNINFFLIYNEGLRGLIAHNLGEQLSDSEMDSAMRWWESAFKQCQSLVTRVQQLQPWREELFSGIFKKKPVLKSTSKEWK